MVTIDLPSCMALGATVAIAQPDASPWVGRFRALAVCLFGFTPLAHLFELYFHDWEWQYTSPPLWGSMAFIIGMNALGLVTYEFARGLQQKQRIVLAAAIMGLVGLYCAIWYNRVFWVGTEAEWRAGQGTFMLSHLNFMLLLAGTGTYLALSTYVWVFRKWRA